MGQILKTLCKSVNIVRLTIAYDTHGATEYDGGAVMGTTPLGSNLSDRTPEESAEIKREERILVSKELLASWENAGQ